MKTKEELNALKSEVEALNKKLAELSDEEMTFVVGGTDSPDRKDHYENIILGVSAEDHNVMLNSTLNSELKVPCKYCHLTFPISKIETHEAVCSENPAVKYK